MASLWLLGRERRGPAWGRSPCHPARPPCSWGMGSSSPVFFSASPGESGGGGACSLLPPLCPGFCPTGLLKCTPPVWFKPQLPKTLLSLTPGRTPLSTQPAHISPSLIPKDALCCPQFKGRFFTSGTATSSLCLPRLHPSASLKPLPSEILCPFSPNAPFFPCFLKLCSFFFFLSYFRATPVAYGGSQIRGLIRAIAAGLCHSHARSSTH